MHKAKKSTPRPQAKPRVVAKKKTLPKKVLQKKPVHVKADRLTKKETAQKRVEKLVQTMQAESSVLSLPTSTKMRVVIIGTGGHGKVVLEAIRHDPNLEVIGFLDDDPNKRKVIIDGLRVLGPTSLLPEFKKQGVNEIALGIGNNGQRERIFHMAKEQGFRVATVIHPTAFIARTASIGEGALICAKAVVMTHAQVGRGAIINTAASIDHDDVIGDFAHVGPGAHIGGIVVVGEKTFVGMGATIIQCVTLGRETMVAAGAVVIRDVPSRVMIAGVPAKVKKKLEVSP
jgi:sugar O-acyltransferase (sialic acid O-acetyltransferase NeuD family)